MEYMFQSGFLGTSAPLFMDMVTLIVAILPLLVYGAIILARKRMFKAHMIFQNIIFIFSLIVVGYFEYGVRVGGGFDAFMSESNSSYSYALVVLVLHIFIATAMLYLWTKTILAGNYNYKKSILPGKASNAHRVIAVKTFIAIIFTSFSGVWVYILLFVY